MIWKIIRSSSNNARELNITHEDGYRRFARKCRFSCYHLYSFQKICLVWAMSDDFLHSCPLWLLIIRFPFSYNISIIIFISADINIYSYICTSTTFGHPYVGLISGPPTQTVISDDKTNKIASSFIFYLIFIWSKPRTQYMTSTWIINSKGWLDSLGIGLESTPL